MNLLLWRWTVGTAVGSVATGGDVEKAAIFSTIGTAWSSPVGLNLTKKAATKWAPTLLRSGWMMLNWLKVPGTGPAFTRAGVFRPGMGVGTAGAAVAGGYILGAGIGTGISYLIWGEEGASDALDFYTGGILEPSSYVTIWQQKEKMIHEVRSWLPF